MERERPDVLISDIAMPEEDGYMLIRRVRALPAEQGGQDDLHRRHRLRGARRPQARPRRRLRRALLEARRHRQLVIDRLAMLAPRRRRRRRQLDPPDRRARRADRSVEQRERRLDLGGRVAVALRASPPRGPPRATRAPRPCGRPRRASARTSGTSRCSRACACAASVNVWSASSQRSSFRYSIARPYQARGSSVPSAVTFSRNARRLLGVRSAGCHDLPVVSLHPGASRRESSLP